MYREEEMPRRFETSSLLECSIDVIFLRGWPGGLLKIVASPFICSTFILIQNKLMRVLLKKNHIIVNVADRELGNTMVSY